ncbi:MAG TPA: HdeD family acid-resistance protein [Rhizomicrobium sp.]|jgi:uncharacterized membrane protein HdeD (DUF308 family)
MSHPGIADTVFHTRVRGSSTQLLWMGIAMAFLGIVALVFPFIATIVAALLVGWVFLFAGIFMALGAFSIHSTGPFFGALLFALVAIAAGVFLLFNPLGGALTLTLVIGILFMFQGASELVFAFEMRPHTGWIWMLISGVASIVLAVLIVAGWPSISAVALGILLGVNFLTTGIGYIAVSLTMKPV